jgi:hypothetical protein
MRKIWPKSRGNLRGVLRRKRRLHKRISILWRILHPPAIRDR